MSYIIAGNIEFKYNGGEEIPQDVLDKASKTVKDIEHGFHVLFSPAEPRCFVQSLMNQ